MRPARIEHHLRADDVGQHELGGTADGTVDVRFGRGVDHPGDIGDERRNHGGVGDVALREPQTVIVLVLGEVGPRSGIRELVQDRDARVGVLEQRVDEVRADETGAAGHEHVRVGGVVGHSGTSTVQGRCESTREPPRGRHAARRRCREPWPPT